jgi:hemoglobin-like flavoprotein
VEKKSDDEETEVYYLDQKSPTQFFYDNFYNHLFTLAPRYKLMFGDDAQKQGKMLAQLLSFIVLKANELTEPHFTTTAHTLASSHNHRKVKAEDYDILGQALLLALKATLGEDYTSKTKAAWITVYSALMIRILPFVAQDKRVYIKKTDLSAGIFSRRVVGQQPAPHAPESKPYCDCNCIIQ